MGFWSKLFGKQETTSKEYRDGQIVKCEKCGKTAIVRTNKPGIAIATNDALKGAALQCQDCGYIVCVDCAYSLNPRISTCPKCNTKNGPYFFSG